MVMMMMMMMVNWLTYAKSTGELISLDSAIAQSEVWFQRNAEVNRSVQTKKKRLHFLADLWSQSEFRTQRKAQRKTDPKSETTYCVMFQSNVDEQRLITQFQISSWSDEECSIPWTRLWRRCWHDVRNWDEVTTRSRRGHDEVMTTLLRESDKDARRGMFYSSDEVARAASSRP